VQINERSKMNMLKRMYKGCRNVVRKVGKVGVAAGVAVVGLFVMPSTAHAQSFDYTVFSGSLTTGATAVAAAAGLLAGISAGVVVWLKIRKYFVKAG